MFVDSLTIRPVSLSFLRFNSVGVVLLLCISEIAGERADGRDSEKAVCHARPHISESPHDTAEFPVVPRMGRLGVR